MTICEELRQAVLQAAIQGKLTEQRVEDGTADELLAEIKREKEHLIKEGKIKREKPLPEISEDEIPFDIPESWRWVRLQEAAQTIVDCPHSTPKYYDEATGFYAIGTKCLNGRGEITKLFNIDGETYRKRVERLVPQENDVVYSREGSIICRAVLLPGDKKICLGQRVMLIRCSCGLDPVYIQKYLMMDSTIAILTRNYKGVGVKHINVADVINLPIPLPPFAEQHRIVAATNTLMEKIDALQAIETELEAMKTAFPGDMRDAILQAAMQGKLTEQLESDGSAEDLLEEITAEKDRLVKEGKIKKEKALPGISEDEIPFDIPENWKWVRLGDLGQMIGGGTPKTHVDAYWRNGTIPWITPADMNHEDRYISNGRKMITWEGLDNSSAQLFPKGSVIISSRAPIGYIMIAEQDAATSQGCKTFSAYNQDLVISEFVYYLMYFRTPDLILRASGTTFKEISGKGIGETVVPLPPLAEQHRIVARLNELLPLCDTLEEAR